jgi:hypothetical protein
MEHHAISPAAECQARTRRVQKSTPELRTGRDRPESPTTRKVSDFSDSWQEQNAFTKTL